MSTAITGHLVQNPHSSDDSRIISVDPSARTGRFRHIAAAVDYAKARATASNPFIIRLLPGITPFDIELDLDSATNVHLQGYGPRVSIVQPTAAWFARSQADAPEHIHGIRLTNTTDCSVAGIGFDFYTNILPVGGGAGDTSAAIQVDGANRLTIRDCYAKAPIHAIWSLITAGGTTGLIEVYNSMFEALSTVALIEDGTWRFYGCSFLTNHDTDLYDTPYAFVEPLSGINFNNSASDVSLLGCHVRVVEAVAASAHQIVGLRHSATSAAARLRVIGGTIRIEQEVADYANKNDLCVGFHHVSSSGSAPVYRFVGTNFVLRTGALTKGLVGGFSIPAQSSGFTAELTGCEFDDAAGSGGYQRGGVVRAGGGIVSGTPTIRVNGGRMVPYVGPLKGSAAVFNTKSANQVTGQAVLAAGTKIVLLITDAGNAGGAADCSFNSASTSVTTASDLTGVYNIGDYIRAASHADDKWTQIKNITASAITLVENYRGATLATTQGKRGTATDQTQPNESYQVIATANLTGETFSVTTKNGSGFTITSSNGASTATVDWMLVR